MDSILDHIDAALRAKGLKDATASRMAAGNPSLIKNIRSGAGNVGYESLQKLAAVLDLEVYFGPRRRDDGPEGRPSLANIDPDQDPPGGFLTIPWAEGRIGKGSAPVAFSRVWLATHNLVPDFLQAAMPDVVALADPIAEDTLALIDTRSALRKGHGLWCYRDAGQVQVSHLTFKGSVTVVHPARPDEEPRIIEGPPGAAISILGKVVWLGQSIPFKGTVK